LILFSVPVIELKQEMLTVYEREEVLIECDEITNNKNDGQPYWEKIDENDESRNLTIRKDEKGRYGLTKDPPSLKILNTQMSDKGYYLCCIDYSASDRTETARSQIIKLSIQKSRHIL
jgi:hypothetical protein